VTVIKLVTSFCKKKIELFKYFYYTDIIMTWYYHYTNLSCKRSINIDDMYQAFSLFRDIFSKKWSQFLRNYWSIIKKKRNQDWKLSIYPPSLIIYFHNYNRIKILEYRRLRNKSNYLKKKDCQIIYRRETLRNYNEPFWWINICFLLKLAIKVR